MPRNWDPETGICRTCQGQGYIRQGGVPLSCPSCRGKKAANNSKLKPQQVIPEKRCPRCAGVGFISTCCGEPSVPCPICGMSVVNL